MAVEDRTINKQKERRIIFLTAFDNDNMAPHCNSAIPPIRADLMQATTSIVGSLHESPFLRRLLAIKIAAIVWSAGAIDLPKSSAKL
jgi:hypothetical protein